MRVFLDTNILLDLIEQRQPYYLASQAVLDTCDRNSFPVFIAWHSLSNIFYIFRRKAGADRAQALIQDLLAVMTVVSAGHAEALRAIRLGFVDLEDAMQAAAAEAAGADLIITRDSKGFAASPVAIRSPEDFVGRFSEGS